MRHQQFGPVVCPGVNTSLYSGYAVSGVLGVVLHVDIPDTVPFGNVTDHVPVK